MNSIIITILHYRFASKLSSLLKSMRFVYSSIQFEGTKRTQHFEDHEERKLFFFLSLLHFYFPRLISCRSAFCHSRTFYSNLPGFECISRYFSPLGEGVEGRGGVSLSHLGRLRSSIRHRIEILQHDIPRLLDLHVNYRNRFPNQVYQN